MHEIHYDTAAPVDTATGKQPVLREIITATHSRYGRVTQEEETRHGEASVAQAETTLAGRRQELAVDKQTREDRTIKEKTAASRFPYKWLLVGVVVGLAIGVGLLRLLRPYR